MVNRRIIAEKIVVIRDGDRIDRGELYWAIAGNTRNISEQPRENPYKVRSGETVFLGNEDIEVSNLRGGDTLTVEGFVAEKDGALSSDEIKNFAHSYSRRGNWGLGSYAVTLQDGGHFKVILHYRIENF